MRQHLLTILILLPVVGALAVAAYGFVPGARRSNYRTVALVFSLVTFAASLLLLGTPVAAGTTNTFHFVEDIPWIESIGAHYHLGADGMSLWLVLLTTLLVPVSILSSWTAIEKRELAFYTFMLLLESAMIGVFCSLDLLLFYLFFEASLVPMFFLIGAWGGERRLYAAIKLFIYTAVGSLLMLAGIIWLWYLYAAGTGAGRTFDYALLLDALPVIGIIYGALVAMVQPDVKRLVAYSSVSHMGFVVLGMFSFTEWGMQGALYQMLNHGVSTGALFLLVGMIYERRHTRMISDFGGLSKPMPLFATFFVITALSSVGLPLLNGFVGEFLIMFGMWNSNVSVARPWLTTMLAATGVIWAAVYMLWMVQRVFFGRVRRPENRRLADLNWREIGLMLPLLALMLFMGAYPRPFLERSRASIEQVRARIVAGEAQGVAEVRGLK